MKFLMVCLGNICRSPLAEGVLDHKFDGKTGHEVDSAGMIDYHAGNPPDPRSIEVASRHGIDISGQRARRIRTDDFDEFDVILAMDQEVLRDLQAQAGSSGQRQKIHLFMDYAGFPAGGNVPDPYYGNAGHFKDVYRMIDEACARIVRNTGPSP